MISHRFARALCILVLTSCGGGDPSGPAALSGTIVFSTNRASGGFDSEIHTWDLRTGSDTRLTTSPGPDEDPVYSPDGQRIAFSSTRHGDFKIYTMNADGSDVRQLTDDYGKAPAWSPDGSTIAFNSRPAGSSEVEISLMNADGSNRRLLPVATNVGQGPKWSPDGQRIAFVDVHLVNGPGGSQAYWQIYTVAVDGTDLKPLSSPTDDDRFPDYSPDGRSIVFSNCNTSCRLFLMNADGTGRQQLTNGSPGDFTPAWSSDGRQIAFARASATGSVHLFVIDADGGGLHQLTDGMETSVTPAWRP